MDSAIVRDSPTEMHYTQIMQDEFVTSSGKIEVTGNCTVETLDHPLARKYLYSVIRAEEGGLPSLNAANWKDGAFIHIRTDEKAILQVKSSGCTRLLILAEKGSELTVVEESTGQASTACEIIVNEGALVNYYSLNDFKDTSSFALKRALVKGTINWLSAFIGGRTAVASVETILDGGSSSNLSLCLCGNGQQDISANVFHRKPSSSDIKSKALVKGSLAFRGMIDIAAPQSGSRLKSDAMLLLPTAKANSIPSLLIRTNEVQAKHASTVTQIDEEQLFYLESRGLTRIQARALLMSTFINEITDNIKEPTAFELFRVHISEWMKNA